MSRLALVMALTLVCLPVRPAFATAQVHERILVNGRVCSIQSTPLTAITREREDLRSVFPSHSTDCWRGYVGTWAIEGDRFYLVSLEREESREKGECHMVSIPFAQVFGTVQAPLPATWYSGTLRIPLGPAGAYVHMGFGTIHERELRIHIVRGTVVSQQVVAAGYEARGRSELDLSFCSRPSVLERSAPVPDDGSWEDARAFGTVAFQGRVAQDVAFRTRGILDVEDDKATWSLWIPATLVTPAVRVPIRSLPPFASEPTWQHVELESTWTAREGVVALDVRWLRLLEPGESIHHPAFPLPDAPVAGEAGAESADAGDPYRARSRADVEWYSSGYPVVELMGTLEVGADGNAQLLGVDVAADPALLGKSVVAVGTLEKWVINERLLALKVPEIAPFRSRGAGTYHRLTDQRTGRPARPRTAAPEEAPAPKPGR